ncbi:hypothetical protein GLOIN_2v1511572 [Rhizophagus irregularis DAOM 181602=DAOM 197198]|nr:hypothetical protein GLOIN_2v1511572 [Rhizophagus irregularis DAOM 181602=DAOM 197198]
MDFLMFILLLLEDLNAFKKWFYNFWNIFDIIAYQAIQKAEILAEIEIFYLLPHQKRWQTWFPEVIHYYADADKTRIEIERLIKEEINIMLVL